MTFRIPPQLEASCRTSPAATAWLERLPALVVEMAARWSLTLDAPFAGDEGSCAWVAPAIRADGSTAVLKLAMPHLEGGQEIDGLRFWDGDPTVRLYDADVAAGALLLERCTPGTSLRALSEGDQDVEIARLLRRLWRPPAPPHPFRPLSVMLGHWSNEATRDGRAHQDPLVADGIALFDELSHDSDEDVLLATDLHAGNVLRAGSRWRVIDPKPFIGDRAYDATQHLLNCRARLRRDPADTIGRFADLLEVSRERVRQWTFARVAVESGSDGSHGDATALARALDF